MKKFNNRSGFTLIEIIVVLIIVGILAAIALPNMFQNVSKSKAQDAFGQFEAYKPLFEACLNKNVNNETVCTSAIVPQPANTPNVTFTYTTPGAAAGAGVNGMSIYAGTVVVGALKNGAAGDTITLARTSAGTYATTCAGIFTGAC